MSRGLAAPRPDNALVEAAVEDLAASVQEAQATGDNSHLFTSSAGIRYDWLPQTDGSIVIQGVQDVYQILEMNQAMLTENDGYTQDRSFRRVASIPTALRNKIMAEEGWDPWQPARYPERYKRLVNDIDYRKLRTAKGRI